MNIPVIAVGLITEAEQAEQILQQGEADAIALARLVFPDPVGPLIKILLSDDATLEI